MRSSLLAALLGLHLLAGGFAAAAGAADFAQRFDREFQAGAIGNADKVLQEWRKQAPNDPEYYIRGARLHYRMANSVAIRAGKPKSKDSFILADPKTGQQVGSMGPSEPDAEMLRKAIGFLVEGTKRFSKRMDIWLGLATLYGEAGDFPGQLRTLRGMVAVVKAHPEGVLGSNGAYPPPVDVNLAQQISNLCSRRFNVRTAKANEEFRQLAELAAQSFPKAVYGHNLVGNYYAGIKDEPAKAIPAYRRALEVAPDDALVWTNLGVCYARLGQKAAAKEAFAKVIALGGDPRSVEIAQRELKKLEE